MISFLYDLQSSDRLDVGSRTLTGAAFQKPQRTDEFLGRGAKEVRPKLLRLVIEVHRLHKNWGRLLRHKHGCDRVGDNDKR